MARAPGPLDRARDRYTEQLRSSHPDAAGETFAAWDLTDGTNVRVQLASHAPGQPWSAATNLSDAGADASAPSLSLSSSGYGAIAWTRSDGAKQRMQVSRRSPGGVFGPADTISAAGVDASFPLVAVDAVGDIVATWMDPATNVMHARRFVAATGMWGTIDDLTPATNPSNQILFAPTLAISPAGVATIAWSLDTDPSNTAGTGLSLQVETRTQGTDGIWTPMVQLSSTANPVQSAAPQLAVDAAGNVTLVWEEYQYTCSLFFCSYTSSIVHDGDASCGQWRLAGGADAPPTRFSISDSPPRVATTPAGEVTVAWTEGAAKRSQGGYAPGRWRVPSGVERDDHRSAGQGDQLGPLPGNPHNDAAHRRRPERDGRRLRAAGRDEQLLAEAVFRPAGGAWPNPATTPPTALSAPGTDIGLGDGPSLTMDGLGNAVATWTRGSVIQAAAFDASPPAFTAVNVPRDRHDRSASRRVRDHARHLVGARRGAAELELR